MSRRRSIGWALRWAIALLAAAHAPPARAMSFSTVPMQGGIAVIGVGPILPGDRARLVALLDALPVAARAKGLLLDSPGGSVLEAERLAGTVRANRLVVGVLGGSICTSACFLLFAAGTAKLVQAGARIGVHSASLDAAENMGTLAMTTAMARDAAAYGVPAGIIGRMVTTEPGRMAWLSDDELRGMGAVFIPNEGRPNEGKGIVRPVPSTSSADPPGQSGGPPGSGFQQGQDDRRAWEVWLSSLTPAAQAGASFWSGQRSLRQPGSCMAPPPELGAARGSEWTVGCINAQRRLARPDLRRRNEPDYRAGWNSL